MQAQDNTAKQTAKADVLGFWKKVHATAQKRGTPIVVLAPMADVTDCAFRQIIAKYSRMGEPGGGPDVLWTEFVSADGLCSVGRPHLLIDLAYSTREHPIVAQLFTSHPDKMREAAALAAELGFDGIDINMGCPDRTIEKQGAGAAMMRDVASTKAVIRAAHEGAPGLPISVKTRIGYNTVELETWLPALLEENLAVVTVHARTRKEMSDVPARWEFVKRAVEIRDGLGSKTLIFGNGDVTDIIDANRKAKETGADGVMLGRAIFGNPWLFDTERVQTGADGQSIIQPTVAERLNVMVEHTLLFEKLLGNVKNVAIMKKHYKAYVSGWDGAKELRMKLMEATDGKDVAKIVEEYLKERKAD